MKVVEAAALTGAAAFASLTRTAIEDHRVQTHKSLAFKSDRAEIAYRAAGAHLTDSKRWASVHRVHHSTPDMNLAPFVELADYLDWRADAATTDHPELPDAVYGFDPAVDSIDLQAAYEIGKSARQLIEGLYQPKPHYHIREAGKILYDRMPRYFYEDKKQMRHDRRNPVVYDRDSLPTLQQVRFLLRDPHSPALHREGVLGVLKDNVSLYGYVERNFEDPYFRQFDLRPDKVDYWTRANRSKLRWAYVGGMALAGALIGRKTSPEKIAANLVAGAAASGAAVLALIAGGNITNAFGHAGAASWREKLTGKKVPVKQDGTYATDSELLSAATLDEVGGQKVHHDNPDFIAYSLDSGRRRIRKAPFGSLLELLVKRDIVFMRGHNFVGHDRRPDLPSEAALMLQEYRAKQLALGN